MSSQALQTNIVGQEFLELSVDELNSSTSSKKEEKEVRKILKSSKSRTLSLAISKFLAMNCWS
jgi:hypothetical protein